MVLMWTHSTWTKRLGKSPVQFNHAVHAGRLYHTADDIPSDTWTFSWQDPVMLSNVKRWTRKYPDAKLKLTLTLQQGELMQHAAQFAATARTRCDLTSHTHAAIGSLCPGWFRQPCICLIWRWMSHTNWRSLKKKTINFCFGWVSRLPARSDTLGQCMRMRMRRVMFRDTTIGVVEILDSVIGWDHVWRRDVWECHCWLVVLQQWVTVGLTDWLTDWAMLKIIHFKSPKKVWIFLVFLIITWLFFRVHL